MRGYIGWICLAVAFTAQAGSGTLRVGSQVLVVGDSATRAVELLGKPSYKSHGKSSTGPRTAKGRKARGRSAGDAGGEQWQYRQGNRIVTIVVVDGRISAIRDGGR
ncbi:DUF2845 domain-containing protein [Dyella jiangningensis]|uniref:DUF2845 domain-containing protein n=1 Tax=Dyella jiangningensis TaxID=1379159 RepID=A0A328P2I0_9GAMM|nr:DUF2845 domain-containing protein [Dyella jiangningensis]RAO74735.1 hypothetical protein CA260_18125 [Dyella jiangningensis]